MAVTVRYGILSDKRERSWVGMSIGELRADLRRAWGLPKDVAAFELPPYLNGPMTHHLSSDDIIRDNMNIEFVRVPSGWDDLSPPPPDPQMELLMRDELARLSRHLHDRDE